jgi:hypothetical protein
MKQVEVADKIVERKDEVTIKIRKYRKVLDKAQYGIWRERVRMNLEYDLTRTKIS